MATTKKRFNPRIAIVIAAVSVAAFLGMRSFIHKLHYEITDNAQIESRSVPIIARVSGYIDSVSLDDYAHADHGQCLIKIDPSEYALAVSQAEADLLNAKADRSNAVAAHRNSLANKKVFLANAEVQRIKLTNAKSDLSRDEELFKEGAITQKQLDDSREAYEVAIRQYAANNEQVSQGDAQVATAEAQIQKAEALIKTREAALEQVRLKLSYCTITAPVSGRVGRLGIEKGQLIQVGQPLFSIVSDQKYWVIANFKETQLGNMKEGQEVSITLDGYPDEEIKGRVASFSQATGAKFSLLPPDNATGNFVKVTQRVPVKIELIDTEKYASILKAGLSALVEVKVD